MRIYLASFFDTRDRLKPIRDSINAMGHEVTGAWIDEPNTVMGLTHKDEESMSVRDLRDIDMADLLILDTFDVNPRGGREVEFGYALGQPTMRVWQVGPRRNIFHALAGANFDKWEDVLHALYQEAGQVGTRPLSGNPARLY